MALWEYKIITSGKGGFASPSLLESYLNQLGKDEWEIIQFHQSPDNPLAFNGIARRSTQREWTLEAAVAAAAKAEADKLRAEFVQKQHAGASAPAVASEANPPTEPDADGDTVPGGELRAVRDTERDNDPEALAEEAAGLVGDWDSFDNFEDDLPTFFDAIKPLQRKNPKGPGSAVGIDYLVKRWEQTEADIVGALVECGFVIPETEDDTPVYLEFEGDLYWVNRNNRGALYINSREKPRPVFRVVKAQALAPDDPAVAELVAEHAEEVAARKRKEEEKAAREAEALARKAEQEARRAEEAAKRAKEQAEREAKAAELAAQPLPQGEALLSAIMPVMRRNRRGEGSSGSIHYAAKALYHSEKEVLAGLLELGLALPEKEGAKGAPTIVGGHEYWFNKDNRGNLWLNGRELRKPVKPASEASLREEDGTAPPAASAESDARTPSLADEAQEVSSPVAVLETGPVADAAEVTRPESNKRKSVKPDAELKSKKSEKSEPKKKRAPRPKKKPASKSVSGTGGTDAPSPEAS